jgi:hypothetical protein
MGSVAFMQMGATLFPDGGHVSNSLQMGATFPQMGATFSSSQLLCRCEMGATDLRSHPDGVAGRSLKSKFFPDAMGLGGNGGSLGEWVRIVGAIFSIIILQL